jgi:hypothetical protein
MRLWRVARCGSQRWRPARPMWVLLVSILLGFDPPQVLVHLDPQDAMNGVEEAVARASCPYLRAEGMPLPVPFEVRWFRREGESQRYVPDSGRRVRGLVTSCPDALPGPTHSP